MVIYPGRDRIHQVNHTSPGRERLCCRRCAAVLVLLGVVLTRYSSIVPRRAEAAGTSRAVLPRQMNPGVHHAMS